MKEIIKKLRAIPIPSTLVILFALYLPIQCRYTAPLKFLSKRWLGSQPTLPAFFDMRLDLYLNELIMIAFIGMVTWKFRSRFKEFSLGALLLFCFLLVSLFSVMLSKSSSYYWPYWRWMQLALPMLFALLLPLGLRKEDLILCLGALLAVALFESLIGIAQYLRQGAVGLKGLGEQPLSAFHSAYIYIESQRRWAFDQLMGYHTITPRILRVAGTLPHPNILGGVLGSAFFVGAFFWLRKEKWRWLLSIALFLIMLTLCLTFSRAAIFGLCGGLCLLGAMSWPLVSKKSWFTFAVLFLFSALLCGLLLREQFLERGGLVNYNAFAARSDQERFHYQNMAFSMFKSHPLFGVGWGQFPIEMKHFIPEGATILQMQTVHNIFLVLATETGAIGLCLFLGFVVFFLLQLWKSPPALERALLLTLWGFLLWFGCCDHFLITMHQGRSLFFLNTGLTICYLFALEKAGLQRPIPQD